MSAPRGQPATGKLVTGQIRAASDPILASLPVASDRLANPTRMRGVTLVELVVSIIIIAIAVSAIMGVLTMLSTGSADAMIRNQAVAIASSYLEEIRLKSFTTSAGTGSRAAFDDVTDYNGLVDAGARDQFGNAIVGLEQYTVRVTVGAGTIGSLSGANVRRIDVNVQHSAAGVNMTISGYRAAL
jgi:MSHA pilin protein MshD